MFLEHLQVNNFRQLQKVEMIFDRQLTFIAGGNNSGKTSLLDMMNFAFSDYKELSYDDMSIAVFENLFKSIEQKVNNLKSKDERLYLFRDYLLEVSSDANFNMEMYFTIALEDEDDLRHVRDFIVAVEDELKLHFLVEYGLSNKKINNREDVVERLYKHVMNFSKKDEDKKSQSDYAHTIDLLNQLSSKKLYYCSCRIDEKGYHYSTDKEKLYDVNMTNYRHFIQTQFIPAQKNLGEYEASEKSLKHLIIQNVSENMADWDEKISEITEQFRSNIDKAISSKELNEQIQYLNNQMMKYQKLNGNQRQDLELVFTHTYQEVERYLRNVWNLHTKDLVNDDAYRLPNSKQGLGFNHLLYIYFYIEMMKTQSQDDYASFNLLVIEEPENHMHPHMQQMLVRYLYEVKEKLNFQIILTTHSSDMVKNLTINDIRVLRKEKNKTKEYDLSTFMQGLEEDKKKFYEKFFGVTMYPLVFSDAAILYEGDTERLFLETILSRQSLLNKLYKQEKDIAQELRNRYISLIPVGGAYAHRYQNLLNYLEIRTLVFTDIDYNKNWNNTNYNVSYIREKETTNEAIKSAYCELFDKKLLELQDLHDCFNQNNKEPYLDVSKKSKIRIYTQYKQDGYARSLEDAILYNFIKHHSMIEVEDVFEQLPVEVWVKIQENLFIDLGKPREDGTNSKMILYRASHALDNKGYSKTDFMYHFLLENDELIVNSIPYYIKEGLKWLVSDYV